MRGGPSKMILSRAQARLSAGLPGSHCCVKNCSNTSHDSYGKHRNNGIQFFRLPKWTQHQGEQVSDLTRRRRIAWLAAIRRKDLTFDRTPQSMRVCSLHFHSGTFSKNVFMLLSLKAMKCRLPYVFANPEVHLKLLAS